MHLISLEVSPWGHIDESDYRKMSWLPVEEKAELRTLEYDRGVFRL